MIQEQFDHIPLQQEEQLLVRPRDDLPYNFLMISHSNFVLQGGPLTDHGLDIMIGHDPIELRSF